MSCSALIVVWVYYDNYNPGGPGTLKTAAYVQYTIYNVLPFLNSALNPVVLIARGKTLRKHVVTSLRWNTAPSSQRVYSDETAGRENLTLNNKLPNSTV